MKCPECGQWNRASMPHCISCGSPLNIDAASRLQWKDTLKDGGPSTAYLRADEFGAIDTTPDARDELAGEMQDLKKRKNEGAELQKKIRRNGVDHPPVKVQITEEPAVRSRRARNDDVPMTAVRVQPFSRQDQMRREESEMRHRVRFMDENGVFAESRTYDPVLYGGYTQGTGSWHLAGPLNKYDSPQPERGRLLPRLMLILLLLAVLGAGGYFGYKNLIAGSAPSVSKDAIVTASLMEDLPAHTILIPGEEGTSIYIRELHASYTVVDGFATIQVADHTWYDNLEGALDETMDVTLTPFLKTTSGKQTPMDLVTYRISIPLSPITLETPEALRTTVVTTMSAIKIVVRPGSRVMINDKEDCSDLVNSKTGEMTYSATVSPKGDNEYKITVRSQYCRENSITVVFYREPQEIPLDLSVNIYGTTDQSHMLVSAKTLPGAYVEVLTPYSDLNIEELDSTGKFTFYAIFDQIGDNTITIRSSYGNLRPSVVNHVVYYLPPPSEYTRQAWPLTAEGYSELLNNIQVRAARHQVYVVKGVVQYTVYEKPQVVVINTSEDGKSQPVAVQNFTKKVWEVGKYYRIYADAASSYNTMPLLYARYTYDK